MSVKQFPEPGAEKQFPFGTNGSFTFDTELSSGVYEVDITGDDSFAASTNALTVSSPDGYTVPVHLDAGEGVVSLPFDANNTLNAASITTPAIASFSKVRYDQGDSPSGVSVSFDSAFSGSYVIDMTIPGDATEAYAYYDNGERDVLGTTFPASVAAPTFDTDAAFSASSVLMGFAYDDDKGLLSRGLPTTQSYPTPAGAFATGGTVYVSGGYRYHKFTANGTFDALAGGNIEYLVVAGGGGGGTATLNNWGGGGGGAGGYVSGSMTISSGSISVLVGAGGGNPGSPSVFSSASAAGGGAGGNSSAGGSNGGSGGGSGGQNDTVGTGIAGQGNNGGNGPAQEGGGGGGKGAVGGVKNGGSGSNSLSAWATVTSSGDSGYFAGGGGGGGGFSNSAGGLGGIGGGGDGSTISSTAATAGDPNTGGGGGGGATGGSAGKTGGSGIVIIRYAI